MYNYFHYYLINGKNLHIDSGVNCTILIRYSSATPRNYESAKWNSALHNRSAMPLFCKSPRANVQRPTKTQFIRFFSLSLSPSRFCYAMNVPLIKLPKETQSTPPPGDTKNPPEYSARDLHATTANAVSLLLSNATCNWARTVDEKVECSVAAPRK